MAILNIPITNNSQLNVFKKINSLAELQLISRVLPSLSLPTNTASRLENLSWRLFTISNPNFLFNNPNFVINSLLLPKKHTEISLFTQNKTSCPVINNHLQISHLPPPIPNFSKNSTLIDHNEPREIKLPYKKQKLNPNSNYITPDSRATTTTTTNNTFIKTFPNSANSKNKLNTKSSPNPSDLYTNNENFHKHEKIYPQIYPLNQSSPLSQTSSSNQNFFKDPITLKSQTLESLPPLKTKISYADSFRTQSLSLSTKSNPSIRFNSSRNSIATNNRSQNNSPQFCNSYSILHTNSSTPNSSSTTTPKINATSNLTTDTSLTNMNNSQTIELSLNKIESSINHLRLSSQNLNHLNSFALNSSFKSDSFANNNNNSTNTSNTQLGLIPNISKFSTSSATPNLIINPNPDLNTPIDNSNYNNSNTTDYNDITGTYYFNSSTSNYSNNANSELNNSNFIQNTGNKANNTNNNDIKSIDASSIQQPQNLNLPSNFCYDIVCDGSLCMDSKPIFENTSNNNTTNYTTNPVNNNNNSFAYAANTSTTNADINSFNSFLNLNLNSNHHSSSFKNLNPNSADLNSNSQNLNPIFNLNSPTYFNPLKDQNVYTNTQNSQFDSQLNNQSFADFLFNLQNSIDSPDPFSNHELSNQSTNINTPTIDLNPLNTNNNQNAANVDFTITNNNFSTDIYSFNNNKSSINSYNLNDFPNENISTLPANLNNTQTDMNMSLHHNNSLLQSHNLNQ
ncbi:hypothetical protein AYI69_g3920, partial [Smittium culicis]